MATTAGDRRIDALANPKRAPAEFQEDRRSVYWIDRLPPTSGPHGVTSVVATPRVQELARHRHPHNLWKGDRRTPIWAVSSGARRATATPRLVALSQHKQPDPMYQFDRSSHMEVRPEATQTSPTDRLSSLAAPKNRDDRYAVAETHWGQFFPVSKEAMKAQATSRVEVLAEHKKYHAMFQGERSIQSDVTEGALKAIASLRLQQLSRPRSRTMVKEEFDPYKVSPAARRAHATPRIGELCVPIPRKVRSKKVI